MVVVDATILMLMLRPDTPVPADPDGVPIDRPAERIAALVEQLQKSRTKIVIPTPALSEALVRAGAAASQEIVERLQKYAVFQIAPFEARAAIEVAAMTRNLRASGKKKENPDATWAKLKYDRQIVAIAKVVGATTIYSDDKDIRTIAADAEIPVIGIADLPLPPGSAQMDFLDGLAAAGVVEEDDTHETEDQPEEK